MLSGRHITEAFDTHPTAAGVPLAGLRQVIFRDGMVLTREGAPKIATNPNRRTSRLKRRLLKA